MKKAFCQKSHVLYASFSLSQIKERMNHAHWSFTLQYIYIYYFKEFFLVNNTEKFSLLA